VTTLSTIDHRPSTEPPPRVIAVDWSGAREPRDQRKKIWLGEAHPGGGGPGSALVRLEGGRDRDEIAAHLIAEAAHDPRFVVGLDFAFSTPEWFLESRGLADAPALWALAAREGEGWLERCEPPFWGRPGRGRPVLPKHTRHTEAAVHSLSGVLPKSVFQIGGAGAVGTGSIRGMPVLDRLRDAGFSIWPFDPPGWPLAVEIYPRVLTGRVNKSNHAARIEYLRTVFPDVPANMGALAASNDDAFDAAVSALVMARCAGELLALEATEPWAAREGKIWEPRRCA
jgi:Protein of unknown function (DUF429)